MSTTLPEQGQPTNDFAKDFAERLANTIMQEAPTSEWPIIIKLTNTLLRQRCEALVKDVEFKVQEGKKALSLFAES